MNLYFINPKEIKKISQIVKDNYARIDLLSLIFRFNALSMIQEAGSGHIGSTFSSMDILTWLWMQVMNFPNEKKQKNYDIFFSSKGHDVPALYSLLIGLGKIEYDYIHKFRRLGGLPGHPDISTPYIITNTGSLGMGISKARGMAIAKRYNGIKGKIYVMTGDGELQEGQIWESLQPVVNRNLHEITVIVDHNKIQSDTWVKNTSDLGDIEEKFKAFGWKTFRCDGHDFKDIENVFKQTKQERHCPQVIISDTVKGSGVSFLEKIISEPNGEFYQFHSGALSEDKYLDAKEELLAKIKKIISRHGVNDLNIETVKKVNSVMPNKNQKLMSAYGAAIVEAGQKHEDLFVLDADLCEDHCLNGFKNRFPERFIECGIAEQDMVSSAGGLALNGKIPVVHSFSCFLSTRANEQIYNNITEKKRIIYVGSLSGLLPATPGHSHQSVRDIALFCSMPGMIGIEPSCESEVKLALNWAIEENKESTYLRFASIPFKKRFTMPENYEFKKGYGWEVVAGNNIAIITSGPIMLNESLKAVEKLNNRGKNIGVISMPWLNTVDRNWADRIAKIYKKLLIIDNHYYYFGQGIFLSDFFNKNYNNLMIVNSSVNEIPECGENKEILKIHKLDAKAIAENLKKIK